MRTLFRGCRCLFRDLCRDGTLPVIVLSVFLDGLLRPVLPCPLPEPWREGVRVAMAFALGWAAWKAACECTTVWRCRGHFVGAFRGRRAMRAMRRLELEIDLAVAPTKRRAALVAYLQAAERFGFCGSRPTPKGMPGWMVYASRCQYLRRRLELEMLRRDLGHPHELRRVLWEACLLLLVGEPADRQACDGMPVPLALLQASGPPSLN